ncbi:MAG: family 16 glycoside hydrolase, partial [Bacteroidota bacterium]
MRLILLTMLSAAMMWSCAPKQQEQDAETGPAANTLTEEEKTAGWVLLFDGQTMNGWRSYKGAEQDCWEVQDGALHCKGSMDADKRADILTTDQYEN